MALLEVEQVTKAFGGLLALDRVSLSIEPGEALGIVGPNGSGKTTLFNVISGVYRPESGRVVFEGEEITSWPPYRRAWRGIARTFQIPRPFGAATVRENVAVGAMFGRLGAKLSVQEALELADHYLQLVGLYDKRDEISEKLTPVEKKTMEIARALAMKPKLLLLDEVMAGMSPKDIDAVVQLIRRLKEEEGIAVVAMVEHIMRAVAGFAERVIVLHFGRKLLEAPTAEALRDPRVVEVYLGRPPKEAHSDDSS